SVLWAGPEHPNADERTGAAHGTRRTRPVSLELGFAATDFGYLIDLGLPQSAGPGSVFARDPEIKREVVFAGPVPRPAATPARRTRDHAEMRADTGCEELSRSLPSYHSVLAEYAHPEAWPELAAVRNRLRRWRFYDGFRVDAAAPARRPQVGTRTPVLSDDGHDLAAAIATITETGFDDLARAVGDAFDGATASAAAPGCRGRCTTGCSNCRCGSAACCGRCVPPNCPTVHCVSCCGPPRCSAPNHRR